MEIKISEDKIFIEDKDHFWEIAGLGIKRKIMSFDDRLMLVKVEFKKDAVGALHKHPHTQITHIDSGSFEVEVEDVKRILNAGDVFYILPNAMHGVVCLEAGILIDAFSPMREDFNVTT